jgi:uncharacterized protein YdhG (YjbR/CyaY superfamily)
MQKTSFRSVDEYIAKQPKEMRPILERVRGIIRKAMPSAKEGISYQIPTYKLPSGGGMLSFAGWKEHYALYPGAEAVAVFRKELAPYEVSKGTVRFPRTEPVPVRLISTLAKFRAQEAARSPVKKKTGKKK